MTSDSESEIVSELAQEYLRERREGKRPSVAKLVEKHPQLAEEIRDAISMLELMEDVAGDATARSEHPLERLGEYNIHRVIGKGGMGTVYEATQESLGRRVALKVCPLQGSERQNTRFRRESRAAAMLHHTNIVPVFAVGEADGFLYYAMQYIRGATLADVIEELQKMWRTSPDAATRLTDAPVPTGGQSARSAGSLATQVARSISVAGSEPSSSSEHSIDRDIARVSLPGQTTAEASNQPQAKYWDSVARIGLQVAEALTYAHNKDTLHRDIKPSNLMLDQSGIVWLMDFGLAKSVEEEDLTRDGELIGTLRYMSPEQVSGKPTSSSDVYSLGLTLYELLTLRPAFDEISRSALLSAITEREPLAPRRLNSNIPRDLETIILKSIEREAPRRYGSAQALTNDLERFLAGEPIQARRIGVSERIRKWARRRPLVAGLTTALALLFCIAFGLVSWQWRAAVLARSEAEIRTREAETQRKLAEASLQQAIEANYRGGISRVAEIARTAPLVATQLLESMVPKPGENDSRSWEWGYLNQLGSQSELVLQCGAPDAEWIRALAFSPDETLLAVGACRTGFVHPAGISPKGRVTLWDVRKGILVQEFSVNDSGYALAISSDNRRVVICDTFAEGFINSAWSGPTWVWDTETGKRIIELEMPSTQLPSSMKVRPSELRTRDLVFLNEDQQIAGTLWRNDRIPVATVIWNAKTGGIEWIRQQSELVSLTESTNEMICTYYPRSSETGLKRIDLQTKEELEDYGKVSARYGQPCKDFFLGIELPKAKNRLYLHDLRTNKRFLLWGDDKYKTVTDHTRRPVHAVHPTKDRLAVGASDGTVRIWNSQIGELYRVLHGHSIDVQSLCYSSSGQWLASGDWNGEVRVWRPERHSDHVLCWPLGRDPSGCLVEDVSFRFGSSNLVGIGGVFDQNTFGDQHARARVGTWDPESGTRLDQFRVPPNLLKVRQRTAKFDPTGEKIASIGTDNVVRIMDFENGKTVAEKDWEEYRPQQIHTSKHANVVAVSMTSEDAESLGRVTVWDHVSNKEQAFDVAKPGAIAISPNPNRLAYAFSDARESVANLVALVHLESSSRRTLSIPDDVRLRSRVSAIEFCNKGERLAVAWEQGLLAICDLEQSQDPPIFREIPEGVQDLAWNPPADRLAGANREFVTLWDRDGQALLELRGPARSGDMPFDPAVTFSSDGTMLAATQWDNSIRIWKSNRALPTKASREFLAFSTSSENVVRRIPRETLSFEALDRTVSSVPDNPWYLAARGQLSSDLRDQEDCLADYLAAKQMLAGDAECLFIHGDAYIESPSLPLATLDGFTIEAWVKHWNYEQPGQVYGVIATQYPMLPRNLFERAQLEERRTLDIFGNNWLRPTEVYYKDRKEWSHVAVCFGSRRTYFLNGKHIGQSNSRADLADEMGPFFVADTAFHNPQVKGRGLIRSIRVSEGLLYEVGNEFLPDERLEIDSDTILQYDFTRDDGVHGDEPNVIRDRTNHGRDGLLKRAWWIN